jgi:hypothetical protein
VQEAAATENEPGVGDRSAIEKLAETSNCPIELVNELYTREVKNLKREAKIRAFVSVIALRRVREALRTHSHR